MMLCGFAALQEILALQADTFSGREAMAVFERFIHGKREAQAAERRAWASCLGSKRRDLIENQHQ